ncbi:MAG: hypothetical protein ABSB66_16090 [Candidatus Acidiferrales bacterium]
MKLQEKRIQNNLKHASIIWGVIPPRALVNLRELTRKFSLSIQEGHLQLLNGAWYITHSGLLRVSENRHCLGIITAVQETLSEPSRDRWVFKATVYKNQNSKGFVGFGDANPANVSTVVLGSEMRIAETRAVNRALRKAYGIGLCSVEELGSYSPPQKPHVPTPHSNGHPGSNGSSNGQPRLRDQLCVLIRQHNLDPSLVKAYAADFCGTATLKEASRDLVETFVTTLAVEAAKDRAALVCKLNSYSPQPEEVNS